MIDANLQQILNKVSTPGDLATVLIAGTAGYIVDAGLNAVGFLEPGLVGAFSASGALGLKKSVEAARNKKKAMREQLKRAKRLTVLLAEEQMSELVKALEIEMQIAEIEQNADGLKAALDAIVDEYRSLRRVK